MKYRQGFVSNSSSSSFVITKTLMTDDQIKKFRKFIQDQEMDESNEGYYNVEELKYYFIGDGDMHAEDDYIQFLKNIQVDGELIGRLYR